MRGGVLVIAVLLVACSPRSEQLLDAGARAEASSPPDLSPPDRGVPPIALPADEAWHDVPAEWWYYTGTLATKAGASYGFELVVFQISVGAKRAYVSHFAVTDAARSLFVHDARLSVTPQPTPAVGFDLTVDGWRASGHAGHDQLAAAMPGFSIDLALAAQKPVVIQYGKGWMTIGSSQPFYYYSYTRMAVTGTLTVDGSPLEVTGEAWMDHQWGEMGYDYQGWDWFSLRLDDQTDVMLFNVRRKDGSGFVGGTWVEPDGKATVLGAGDFSVEAASSWSSPHTSRNYPQGWRVRIPSRELDLTVTPVLADQEVYKTISTPIYWEGLCTATGTRRGAALGGRAYVELTGY
jgi:predicted secreted hydrolase